LVYLASVIIINNQQECTFYHRIVINHKTFPWTG